MIYINGKHKQSMVYNDQCLIVNHFAAALTIKLTHAGEIIWKDMWDSFIHTRVDL